MEYLLIMQLIFDGNRAGGATIESVKFESLVNCEKAKSVFILDMKETRPLFSKIYRQAECVKLTNAASVKR